MTATTASAAGRLIVLLPTQSGRIATLELETGELGRVARFNLVLRNDGDSVGRLRIQLFPDRGGTVSLRSSDAAPFPSNRPVLFSPRSDLVSGQFVLRPRRTVRLPLRIGISASESRPVVGVLVAELISRRRVAPALVRVRAEPSSTAPTAPSPQPSKLTLRGTRSLPLGLGDDAVDVTDAPRIWVPGEASAARALLSGAGNELEIRLGDALEGTESPPLGMVEQPVEIVGGAQAGTYTGRLELRPGEPSGVDVEAQIRDHFFWAVAAISVAAALGGLLTTWWQRRRRRQILINELDRAVNEYADALAAPRDGSPVERLDGPFDPAAIAALKSTIGRAQTGDEFEAATEEVRSVRNAGRRWMEIDATARRVLDADKGTPKVATPVRGDNREVLARTRFPGDDEKHVSELINRLRRQERIALAFRRAWDQNPLVALVKYVDGAYAADASTADLLHELADVDADDRVLLVEYGVEQPEQEQVLKAVQERRDAYFAQRQRALDTVRVLEPGEEKPVETPAQVERRIRVWDWWLATTTAAITIVAFAVTLYDSDFGSWEDYLKAIGAGFGTQAAGAAVWSLFPILSSYRLPPKKPA